MDVARAMVLVLDHFDHALDVDPANTSPDALLTGVRMVRDELLGALERFGVKRFEVKQGDEFDPHRHEALMRQAIDGLEPDRIADQIKPGYTLEDKTLRPAQVSVTE
jgi:molecular chaperone GrpE